MRVTSSARWSTVSTSCSVDAALELQRRQAGGDLVEAAAVLVERGQRLVGLGQHDGDVPMMYLDAVDVERDDVAALRTAR